MTRNGVILALGATLAAFALALPGTASAAPEFTLAVNLAGGGAGEVECEAEGPQGPCEAKYPGGTELTLVPVAGEGSEFAGFSAGAGSAIGCTGTGPCSFTIAANSSVTATFELEPLPEFALTVKKTGTGTGTVECEVGGLAGPCASSYPEGTELTLIATADPGSEFIHWTGACAFFEESEECELTMEGSRSVTATFNLSPALTVKAAGTGTGTVECEAEEGPGPCAARYPKGTELILYAIPDPGSKFVKWAGCDSVVGSDCEVEMSKARSVTVTFDLAGGKPKFTLTVTKSGTGTGTVTSSPSGINCGTGAGCEAEYDEGTEVTLSPAASSGSQFTEWTGACTGSGACKVTMSAAKSVGAKFDLESHTLTVSLSGTGSGTVKGLGINCPGDCTETYLHGTTVALSASSAAGSEFKEWTGACSGSGACEVTMTSNKSVTAKFNLAAKPKFKLTVSKSGTGSGTVTSTPAAINCGSGTGCEAEYDEGTEVTLSQAASAGSEFKEWTGACTGSGSCKVTMSAAKLVGAKFDTQSGGGGGGSGGSGGSGGGGGSGGSVDSSGGDSGGGGGGAVSGTARAAGTAAVSGGRAALELTCSAGTCKGTLQLVARVKRGETTKSVVIGKADFSFAAGAAAMLRVKLSSAAKNELDKGRKLKAKLSGIGIAASTVEIRPARRKHPLAG